MDARKMQAQYYLLNILLVFFFFFNNSLSSYNILEILLICEDTGTGVVPEGS